MSFACLLQPHNYKFVVVLMVYFVKQDNIVVIRIEEELYKLSYCIKSLKTFLTHLIIFFRKKLKKCPPHVYCYLFYCKVFT